MPVSNSGHNPLAGRGRDLGIPSGPPPHGDPDDRPSLRREYHGRRTMLVSVLVIGAVAAALWVAFGTRDQPTEAGAAAPGVVDLPTWLATEGRPIGREVDDLAVDFELETLEGDRFRLSDWRGHPILLNFWATWCTPCRKEVPVLIRLQEQYRDAGFLVIGVNIEESRSVAQEFVEEFGINYTIPMDFGGSVTRRYLRVGPPNSYFIRPDGVITQAYIGQAPDAVFEEGVADLVESLATPPGPEMAPGLKALPISLAPDDESIGIREGTTAPDFVLATANQTGRWRLSDQRGTAVSLLFVPPDCRACGALPNRWWRVGPSGVEAIVVAAEDVSVLGKWLRWNSEVAGLYEIGDQPVLIVIDEVGRVRERQIIES